MKMKFRGILSKTLAAAVAAAQVISVCGFAAVTGGGSGTDSGFYWYEDFAGDTLPDCVYVPTTQTDLSVTLSSGALVLKNANTSSTASNYFLIKGDMPYDFSKGDIVISYDMTLSAANNKFRAEVSNADQNIIAGAAYANGTNLQGYICDTSENATYTNKNGSSTITPAANTLYNIELHLSYNETSNSIDMKQYVNGQPLIRSYTNAQFVYTNRQLGIEGGMAAALAKNWAMRFYVYGGAEVKIDNVIARTEGKVDLPDRAWINKSTSSGVYYADVNYTNSVSYLDNDGNSVAVPAILAVNRIEKTSQFELKKYNLDTDPLMLDGETVTTATLSPYKTAFQVSNLPLTSDSANECFVLKSGFENVMNYNGTQRENPYILMHRLSNPPIIRESALYSNDTNIALDNGKLPVEADKLEITVSNFANVTAEQVTFGNDDVSVKSAQSGKTFTLNLPTLEEGTDYNVTVGDTVVKLTTTGEKPASHYATAAFQGFDDEASAAGFVTTAEEISTTWQNGSVLCTNSVASTGTAVKVSYPVTGTAFDFSKGALYLSFDATLNQDIGSILFGPELIASSGTILAYMPGLEFTGLRGRNSSGGRVKTNSGKTTMANGDTVNLGILLRYYPEDGSIGYIQFADGKRLEDEQGNPLAEILKTGLSDKLSEGLQLRINGRNFPDGVYIDNIRLTTVDGITAEQVLTMSGTTATIDIENTVEFDPSAPSEVTAPVYNCSLTKNDIKVTRYAAEDKLFVNGTAVTDFGFAPETMTVSNLAAQNTGDVFVIEILDASKLASLAEKELDVKCFKTGEANGGLIKTRILNANGDEIYVDADGNWPTNAVKICFTFAKGYAEDGVKLGETEAVYTDGEYVVDLSVAPFDASTEYTVSVNNAEFAKFTTAAGAFSVLKPMINEADGKASVGVSNTTDKEEVVYLINACYNSDGELTSLVYDRITVAVGENSVKTGTSAPDLTGAAVQKAFVWDGFEKLMPYADCTERTLSEAE
ncbi:MAG: hypothetical protein ACI4DY_02610 [Monoglobaceae bacterium]